jgi:hypothetical protein
VTVALFDAGVGGCVVEVVMLSCVASNSTLLVNIQIDSCSFLIHSDFSRRKRTSLHPSYAVSAFRR